MASSKTLSMFLEVSPRYWLVIMESRTSTMGRENLLERALAVEVLPVPGGPTKRSFPISYSPISSRYCRFLMAFPIFSISAFCSSLSTSPAMLSLTSSGALI